MLAICFELLDAYTNRHTTARGLCYEETEVVIGDAVADWSAFWLMNDADDDGVGQQSKQTWESGTGSDMSG